MKVLILTITAGQGHNSTARAISDCLAERGVESRTVDTYRYFNRLLGKTVSRGYLLSVDNAKALYARVYSALEKRKKNANEHSPARDLNHVFIRKMTKLLDEYDPDVIVCTHIFAGMIVDVMKEERRIRAHTVGILTDFTFHPYWEEALHFDYVVTPSELMELKAEKKGFRPNQILPYGIPIRPCFSGSVSRAVARAQFGLDPDRPTVLLMGGSMGYGGLEKNVRALDGLDLDLQMIVICGSNASAKKKIDALETKKKVANFGYVDFVDRCMDAADCLVTKPGGITTSEALAKNLPLIIVNPIPGQEERNTEFLLNNGVAMRVSESYPLDEIVYELFRCPERLELMRRSIGLLRKPNAAADICDAIIRLASDATE